MSTVFITGRRCGGFRMRGEGIAALTGWPSVRPEEASACDSDAVVLVKYDDALGPLIRRRCRVLVYDPLDAWMREHEGYDPFEYFQREYLRLGFDAIVATSPSAAAVMKDAMPPHVRVVFSPHHADPVCQPSWYDPHGPVVYAGGPKYLGKAAISRLAAACADLGRTFRVDDRKDALGLQGAAACIALRLPPHDTGLNRLCKPQVKLANALACGIPALASAHPCSLSLYPDWPIYVDPFPVASQLKTVRLVEQLLARPRPTEGSTPPLGAHARLLQETVHDLLGTG